MRFGEFSKNIKNLKKLAEGWRGVVYVGEWEGKKVAVKVAKKPQVEEAIRKEAKILERLKGLRGFPQIILSGEDFFIYEFIEGVPLRKAKLSPQEERKVLNRLLELAYLLDSMGIGKDEFGRLDKNVLVGEKGEVYLIDFERGKLSDRPTNLTQYLQFLVRKGILTREEAIELGRRYLKDREGVYEEVSAKLK